MNNKTFTTGAIIEMIIAALCLAVGLVIIIFNIIMYPKFKSLIYSIIGLFAIILILVTIGIRLILKYRSERDNNQDSDADSMPESLSQSEGMSKAVTEAASETGKTVEPISEAEPPNAKDINKNT